MAIQLTKELESGFVVEYWKIDCLIIEVIEKNVRITYNGYKDESARRDGKVPTSSKLFTFSGSEFVPFSEGSYTSSEILAHCYTITKTDSFFSGGIDC